jgi:hypothetical protein
MKRHEDPSIIIKVFEGEDQDLDFFKDSFSYQVSCCSGSNLVIHTLVETRFSTSGQCLKTVHSCLVMKLLG